MFASLFRADAAGDRSPTSDFWYQPVGGLRTAAGQRVSADTAMQLGAVFGCVQVLSLSMGVLPFNMYRPKVGGGRTKLKRGDHWLMRLLARRPNPLQNWFEWRTMMQGHLALRGNAYNVIQALGAEIVSLTPVHPDKMRVEPLDNGSWRYVRTMPNGEQVPLTRQQVWHLRALSNDGIKGLSPIEAVREVIGGALGAQDYGNRFWANDGKPTSGWIEYPSKFQDKAARDLFKDSAREATTGANRHRMMVLENGMKYHEVGLSNKDSQFLEARKFQQTEICGIFRVPPHMIANLDRATFSNIEQQGIDFWQNTMLPWVTLWEAAAEDLLGDDGPDSELEVEFDFKVMLRGDAASRSAFLHSMVLDGVINRNEAREFEGYDPADGLDEFLVPANEMTQSESENPTGPITPPGVGAPAKEAPGGAPEDDEDDAPAPKKKGADARVALLVSASADRMARRIAKGDTPPAATLADALAIDEAAAQAWIDSQAADPKNAEAIAAGLRLLGGVA